MAEVVMITGVSAGVGRAVAQRLARRGCSIGLIARGRERLDAAATEVDKVGGRALSLQCDVADPGAVEEAAGRAEAELGPIDSWINNAMATIFSPLHKIEPDEYRRSTDVTYLGTVWGTMTGLRRMRGRNRGTIVLVGSALAYRGIPLQAPYCGAKHAIKGFFESLRSELMHQQSAVRLTMVQLPANNTPQFSWGRTRMPRHPQPVPPIFQPDVAAEAIEYAAYHHSRQLYVGWPSVKVITGNKLAPGLIDRYLARQGYDAQQTDEPVDDNRPDNLFDPAPGDFAAHGVFDAQAKRASKLLRLRLALGRLSPR